MTVKELIGELQNFDESSEVWLTDYVEGDDFEVTYVKEFFAYNSRGEIETPHKVVYIG